MARHLSFWWMGQLIDLSRIIRHHRFMARTQPEKASFWRRITLTMIAEYRAQVREQAEGIAA